MSNTHFKDSTKKSQKSFFFQCFSNIQQNCIVVELLYKELKTQISFVEVSSADNHFIGRRNLREPDLRFYIQLIQSGFVDPPEVVSLHQSREEEIQFS